MIEDIKKLRKEGFGYKRIATELDITREKARYHCGKIDGENIVFSGFGLFKCEGCNQELEAKGFGQKYCGETCRKVIYQEKRHNKKAKQECITCKKEMPFMKNKYCSEVCFFEDKKKTCVGCGVEYVSKNNSKHCSHECQYEIMTCDHCGIDKSMKKTRKTNYCGRECLVKSRRKSHYDFTIDLIKVHKGMLVPLEEYKGSDVNLKCICLKCKKVNEKIARFYIGSSSRGCVHCGNYSNGEDKIRVWLEEEGIDFEREYTFDDLMGERKLRYDFAVFKDGLLKVLIEYDGQHHFEPIETFGGEGYYESVLERDKIKNEYATDNNLKLIRIPYYKKNEINSILLEGVM